MAYSKIEEYIKLFHGYINCWRQNLPFFRRSISSLWKKMRVVDVNKWLPLIDKLFLKMAREAHRNNDKANNGLCAIHSGGKCPKLCQTHFREKFRDLKKLDYFGPVWQF